METSNLSDYQLYEIIQNKKLHNHIRIIANKEFNKRDLTINELREIVIRHESISNPGDNDKPLSWQYKILLIIFPFVMPLQGMIASKFLSKGESRKWKAYRIYICLGYAIWTVALLAFTMFYSFRH